MFYHSFNYDIKHLKQKKNEYKKDKKKFNKSCF